MSKTAAVSANSPARRTRRRWPIEQKRRIVEASYATGVSIAEVAREHGVNTNQLHSWRRLYERGLLNGEARPGALLAVRVVPDAGGALPVVRLSSPPSMPAPKPRRHRVSGVIQMEVERGRLRIEGAADPISLRVVLESLLG